MATTTAEALEPQEKPKFNFETIRNHPAFWPGVAVLVGIIFCFWPLMSKLPDLWLADDGYYSHGFLVPIIAGMIIVRWWPRFKDHEFKTFWPALIPLFFVIAVFRAAYATDIPQIMSLSLLAALFFGVWFAMGGKWAWRMSLPIGYLLFMLPIWTGLIDNYTNPLQRLSTRVAFQMLNVTGFEPHQDSETVIYLNNFVLDVGVPCSGFKLVLAVTAFMIFFVAIARLNVWSNMIMFASVLPICLFINGLRIALIGVVGDYYGREAGMTFHDYSGYITLVVCFFMLFKLARWLGWKD